MNPTDATGRTPGEERADGGPTPLVTGPPMPAGLHATHRYDDIIDLPHPEPRRRPRMPIANRAAQFMPFAALAGYDDVLRRAAGEHAEAVAAAETAGDADWGA